MKMKNLLKRTVPITISIIFVFSVLVACAKKETRDLTSEINALASFVAESVAGDDEVTLSKIEDVDRIPELYMRKFDGLETFEAITEGSTVALIVSQSIDNRSVKKYDRYYTHAKSDSAFVKTEHFAYFYSGKVAYRDADGEFTVSAIDDYLKIYGVYPATHGIEGYIVNEKTVISVVRSDEKPNEFVVTLDGETAGLRNKIQMRKYGGLSDYPTFKSVTLTLELNEDLTPVSVKVFAEYTVPYGILGDVACTQNYTVTYKNVNGNVDIPDENVFDMIN